MQSSWFGLPRSSDCTVAQHRIHSLFNESRQTLESVVKELIPTHSCGPYGFLAMPGQTVSLLFLVRLTISFCFWGLSGDDSNNSVSEFLEKRTEASLG